MTTSIFTGKARGSLLAGSIGVLPELQVRTLAVDNHLANLLGGTAGNVAVRGKGTFHIAACRNERVVADRRARADNRVRSNEAAIANLCLSAMEFSLVPSQGSLDRIVGVEVRAGPHIDVIADRQAALAIQHRERADPAMPANF